MAYILKQGCAEWPDAALSRKLVPSGTSLRVGAAEGKGNAHWFCTMSKAKRSKQVVLPIDRMFKRGITRDRSEWTRCSGILYWPALDELRFSRMLSECPFGLGPGGGGAVLKFRDRGGFFPPSGPSSTAPPDLPLFEGTRPLTRARERRC